MSVITAVAEAFFHRLESKEDLREAVWNGTYKMPDLRWTYLTDRAGRVTFLARVTEADGTEQIVHIFTVTEFDLTGLQEVVNDAALKLLTPSD